VKRDDKSLSEKADDIKFPSEEFPNRRIVLRFNEETLSCLRDAKHAALVLISYRNTLAHIVAGIANVISKYLDISIELFAMTCKLYKREFH